MPAKVTQLSVEGLRTTARKLQKHDAARKAASVRATVAEENNDRASSAFVRLANRCRGAASSAIQGGDGTYIYREYRSGLKSGLISGYDRLLTGGDPSHVAKLHQPNDLEVAIKDLTFGGSEITNPMIGALVTCGSISIMHKLGGGGSYIAEPPVASSSARA